MRLTCIICTSILIALGIFGGLSAFTGVDLLLLVCFGSVTAARCFLAVAFVAALFDIYALAILRPFKGLK